MDFSKLIDKKILQKKPQARWSRKRKQAADEDTSPNGAKVDTNEVKSKVETDIKVPDDKVTSTDYIPGLADDNAATEYTAEEKKLASELSVEDINSKLSSFNELDNEPDISKLEKIRKLGILLHKQQKNQVYQDQLNKEDKVPMNLDINEIGRTEFQSKHYTQLRKYIKYLIKCWESQLEEEDEVQSPVVPSSGGSSGSLLVETKRDIIPLLYKLRKENLPLSMFTSLTTVIYYLQSENYRLANETYLKLSIGNAAWPVGVRSVGIHQRAADLKITGSDKKSATNIMMGDKTRRWITAVKRIITFCEKLAKLDTKANGVYLA